MTTREARQLLNSGPGRSEQELQELVNEASRIAELVVDWFHANGDNDTAVEDEAAALEEAGIMDIDTARRLAASSRRRYSIH